MMNTSKKHRKVESIRVFTSSEWNQFMLLKDYYSW